MGEITTIGLDLAKHVFQVHGIDAMGQVIVGRQLRRGELLKFFEKQSACLVGMEACGTSHHWAHEIAALGHTVKMMPPAYVKPHVKRGKTDAADAEAICEAVTRPTMRFVPTKTVEQQSVLMLHKTRNLLIKQRTLQHCQPHPTLEGVRHQAGVANVSHVPLGNSMGINISPTNFLVIAAGDPMNANATTFGAAIL